MSTKSDKIMELVPIGSTCNVPDLTRIIYPDVKEWDYQSAKGRVQANIQSLQKYGYFRKKGIIKKGQYKVVEWERIA